MSAPKTRVWMSYVRAYSYPAPHGGITIPDHWSPNWSCECGEPKGLPLPSVMDRRPLIERYIEAATAHSRTHAAERIADEMASRMEQHRNTAHNSGGFESYHYGVATGYERAATLIREHLT